MLKIAFIHPSSMHNRDIFRNQPLVMFYILTIIEKQFNEKVELSLIDLRGVESKYALRRIMKNDVYLYSIATPDFTELYNISVNLRSIYPDAKHIAGGPHISIFPEHCATLFDAIIIGEGEESIIRVIDDILNSKMSNVYRQEGYIDLNKYPYPDRKYLPDTTIVNTGILRGEHQNLPGTEVIFSRGCPFSCHFCGSKRLNFGPIRYRHPNLIIEEIEYLKKEYRIDALALKDDNSIPPNIKIAKPYLEAIGKTEIKWRGQTRANGIHPDMVKLAWECGCTDIGIGIESASLHVLDIINKKINLNKAVEYIRLLDKTGIGVRLHFILGLPGEKDDIVRQTLNFIDNANPKSVLLTILCPIPGSEMFDHPEKFGIEIDTLDWERYHATFGRFDAKELPDMVFHYKDGKGMSNDKILQNFIELQTILRDRKLNF